MRITLQTLAAIALALVAQAALADGREMKPNDCPVGLVSGQTLDQEFGPGSEELTRCIKKTHHVKVMYQINQFCASSSTSNSACTKPYALGNIDNMIKDYEITNGMEPGRDFEIVVVVHSGGAGLILKDEHMNGAGTWLTGQNQFQSKVESLMAQGVKFCFCQNTARSLIKSGALPAGDATAQMIDGVMYTTAGVSAIADFQALGYSYIQP